MRKLSCCIALVVMLCLSGAVFAQNTAMTLPCGNLSEADCTLLTNAQTASSSLDSQMFDFNLHVNISNLPEMNEPLAFSLTGSGSTGGMAALQSHMMAMQSSMMGTPDFSALQENFGEIADALREFSGDLNLTLALPADLMAMAGPNMPDNINLQIRMVDGIGYLNLDPLQPILARSGMSNMSGWIGIDVVGLLQAAFEQIDSSMLSSGMDMSSSDAMMGYMEAFSDPEFLANFMTIERTDDGSGDTAVFEFTFDFSKLMASPEFQNMMRAQMEEQMAASGVTLSEDEMGAALAMSSQMMKGITMSMTEEIGLEDGFIHSINGSVNVDTRGMMTALSDAGEVSQSTAETAPVIDITFGANYSSFNSAPEITAPEDAMIIPYESLIPSGSTGGAGAAPVLEMTPTPTPAS